MNRKMKIGIIGHFGNGKLFLDGQTVKTKVLYDSLNILDKYEIMCVDTYFNKVNKFKLLFDTIKCIFSCKVIILLIHMNGMKVYYPMLYYAAKLFKRDIYQDVIGGDLPDFLEIHPNWIKYLNGFRGNWVEFNKMKEKLEILGVSNCTVIPNFKNLSTDKAVLNLKREDMNTFCMFSRVMEGKGITDAIIAIHNYNLKHDKKAKLNIWGPVDGDYRKQFDDLLAKYSNHVSYRGCIAYNESVETITNHLALLFPTHFPEGFPGTVADSYASALPLITNRKWDMQEEMVEEFATGIVYPCNKFIDLEGAIEWAMEHQEEMISMRKNCLIKIKEYSPETQIKRIIKFIDGK